MMADEIQDISDYRDAIEGLLLNGEELEATFPAVTQPSYEKPRAIAITTSRLIICYRSWDRGKSDRWTFHSLPYSQIVGISLGRSERFHRDRIEAESGVVIFDNLLRDGRSREHHLSYRDPALGREVHDRILTHLLDVEARGLP